MKLMVASFLILWSLSVNANAEPGVCAPDELNLGSGVNSVNTIFPRMMKTNLHYVFKKYSGTSGKCKSDEVQVTGPLFQEGFHNSKGEPIPLSALSTEVTVNPDGNQFCLKSSEFKREQTLAGSVFRTQIASGSGNEGTSFLLGGNVVMTNHHIAVAGNVPPACGGLKINANQDGKTWIPCKRILYCEPAPNDFCLVEMQPPLGKARVSDLVNKVKLNCSQVKEQPAKLIGNSALLGIQSADGPVHEEALNGVFRHHAPMTGGASGSPIVNASGEVLGINHSHDAGAGDFVGMTPATHSNYGTSMKHVLNAITVASKKNAVLLNLVHEIQKDNPTCKP